MSALVTSPTLLFESFSSEYANKLFTVNSTFTFKLTDSLLTVMFDVADDDNLIFSPTAIVPVMVVSDPLKDKLLPVNPSSSVFSVLDKVYVALVLFGVVWVFEFEQLNNSDNNSIVKMLLYIFIKTNLT